MDESLTIIAQDGLRELLTALGGNNLTCYFYNPFSELYWLFHKEGEFDFPCQMHGPLTHPEQRIRMESDLKREKAHTGVTVFKNSATSSLATRILAEEPFTLREGILSTIRIRILPPKAHEKTASQVLEEPFVVIFVNYTKDSIPTQRIIDRIICERQAWIDGCLLTLAEQPRIEPPEAWRLRSMNLNFRQKLAQVLVNQPIKENQTFIYEYIVQQARELIRLRHGAINLLCTLSTVNNNNEVQIVASDPPDVSKPCKEGEGIVEYVARAGRIYYVDDVQKYEEMPPSKSRPKYIKCINPSSKEIVKSELVCPLIIQGKIVGVLNLEANQSKAYDDDHILLLFQFASTAALAVRQIELFRDLNITLRQNRELLSCVSKVENTTTPNSVYNATLQAASDLGYECQIWDRAQKRWYRLKELHSWPDPRPAGFTNWVVNHKRPVALIDLQKDQTDFGRKAGILGEDLLFQKWEEFPNPDIPPNPASHGLIRENADIICDFGFPIGLLNTDKPSAVLWARCNRYYQSLLTDESWCLSLFCRMASEALKVRKVIEKTRTSLSTSASTQSELIRYHFGWERQENLERLLKRHPNALTLKKASNVITLSIDLRNSTKLSAQCLSEPNFERYKDFVRKFHSLVRESAILKGGVMDKTIGDGAHILFNVYKPELLNIKPYDDTELAKKQAVECAYLIEEKLRKLIEETNITSFDMSLLCLGAGLTMGEAFVGGIDNEIRGYEYSAYSHDTNHAGKLVSMARSSNVLIWFKRCIQREAKVYCIKDSEKVKLLTLGQVRKFITVLEKESISLLFTDSNFERVKGHVSYIVPTANEDGSTQTLYFLTRV